MAYIFMLLPCCPIFPIYGDWNGVGLRKFWACESDLPSWAHLVPEILKRPDKGNLISAGSDSGYSDMAETPVPWEAGDIVNSFHTILTGTAGSE